MMESAEDRDSPSPEGATRERLARVAALAESRNDEALAELVALVQGDSNLAVVVEAAQALLRGWGPQAAARLLLIASTADVKDNQLSWTLWDVLHEAEDYEGLPVARWLRILFGERHDSPALQLAINRYMDDARARYGYPH